MTHMNLFNYINFCNKYFLTPKFEVGEITIVVVGERGHRQMAFEWMSQSDINLKLRSISIV